MHGKFPAEDGKLSLMWIITFDISMQKKRRKIAKPPFSLHKNQTEGYFGNE